MMNPDYLKLGLRMKAICTLKSQKDFVIMIIKNETETLVFLFDNENNELNSFCSTDSQ